MHTLLELAERCEKATGPAFVLDEAIRAALVGATIEAQQHRPGNAYHRDGQWVSIWPIPSYTASLDAAMMLVPSWWATSITRTADGRTGHVNLYKFEGDAVRPAATVRASAATPALALCAAALRARASAQEVSA